MKYLIGGVNGTGKTTFLNWVKERESEFDTIKASAQLLEWFGLAPGDYQSLRALSSERKNKEFEALINSVLDGSDRHGRDLLIDGHYLNYANGRLVDVIGSWVARLDSLVLLEAHAASIWNRVKDDPSRTRYSVVRNKLISDRDYIRVIEHYKRMTREKAMSVAKKYGKRLIIIQNNDGDIREAVDKFMTLHKVLTSSERLTNQWCASY